VHDPTKVRAYWGHYREVASLNRVVFNGEGPDNALWYEWLPYVRYLVHKGLYGRLVRDVCGHMVRHRRIPLLPTVLRMPRARREAAEWPAFYPDWLNRGLQRRLGLRERWEAGGAGEAEGIAHPLRPHGYRSFGSVAWESHFRCFDAEVTRAPLEVRHPYVDLRLLRFMLAVPAIPWCRAKYLVRRSMAGMLPKEVLSRSKASVCDRDGWPPEIGTETVSPLLAQYVDLQRLAPAVSSTRTGSARYAAWYVFSLNDWLQQFTMDRTPTSKERDDEPSFTTVG
jgi:asparagine synthase (glutamine-hydrolysing)